MIVLFSQTIQLSNDCFISKRQSLTFIQFCKAAMPFANSFRLAVPSITISQHKSGVRNFLFSFFEPIYTMPATTLTAVAS